VETAGQADVLRDLGCDQLQGPWYGQPRLATEIVEVLPRG
jgi:EAL domain-containing protein (putative c-di-GMP-specific phosphodiesterase class I)